MSKEDIMLEKGRANVIVRGKNTLFMLTAEKPDGSPRDANLAREQIAFILGVPLKEIVPNHSYNGKPEDAAYVFRYKDVVRNNVHSIGLPKSKRGQFINKNVLFNFIDETEAAAETPKPKGKEFKTLLEDDDEPKREGDVPTLPPTTNNDLLMLLIKRQDEQAVQLQMLAEIMGKLALKL